MLGNVLKGIIILLLAGSLYMLKIVNDSLTRLESKIPPIKVYTYADLAAIRKSKNQDSMRLKFQEQSVFSVTGNLNVDVNSDVYNPVRVEIVDR